ncbi:TPM domain-containing protein [Nocardia cyriacigeorgica]|uniref:TPM domain-containing protein n=1 Tax=Nocardia cyriacigeorgica TaxID=135487 RepID=A0A6P1DEB7_9NOCA|nr:TPM domain-containing protein [Nocardia cyriacigeorgica]NEW39987.1 TPM domain-containing protein [Nocardia cyriacigeorgica]NEW48001.1 TPM domain-containing protein [Nocardia cyriacigeorgica]NEW53839.1 TPM domain-containing protein [Nocardia cyriacigeorgica]
MALHRVVRWSLLVVLGVALVAMPAAHAEPPTRMDTYVVDSANALGSSGVDQVRGAVDRLYADHQVRLWVYYVRDFAGLSPQDWAAQTSQRSGFGERDLLLAVAVDDRAYAFDGVPPSGVSESELDRILTADVESALRDSRWADAGVAAADGIGAAMSGGGVSVIWVLAIGVLIVGAVGALVLFTRKRRRNRERAELERARTVDPADTAALAALPLPVLHARSRELLVDIDNAVRTSADELELATGEFGDTAVTPFRTALDQATAAMGHAFAIRQRLDDAIPETPDEQRTLLIDLIGSVGRADRELDEQVAAFDSMRDLLINAGERLDALTRDLVELTGRVPAAEQELNRLDAAHPPQVLTSIRDNTAMARERITFAEQSIDSGREALRRQVGDQGGAVAAIRAAEGAIGQARTLLDAVLHAATTIEQARAGLPAALEELRDDLAAAADLTSYGGAELATATAHARAVLENIQTVSPPDPVGAFHSAVSTDAELDRALAGATDRKLAAEDLRRRLDQAMTDARARVRAAADYISTRRGGIDAAARTRLTEAQRHLDGAIGLRDSDPATALSHARTAADLGGRALQEAQTSVQSWEAGRAPSGGAQAGAILGGILIEGLLRGAATGGRRGGYGGGYRAPSFGGSSGSRRISRGGRF